MCVCSGTHGELDAARVCVYEYVRMQGERERQTDRQTDRERERERERDAHTHMRTPTVYGDRQEPVRETESGLPATGFFCIDNLVL